MIVERIPLIDRAESLLAEIDEYISQRVKIQMNQKLIKIVRFILILLLVASLIWWVNKVGIEQIRTNIEQFGVWVPIVLLMLRMVSIVIPALPGTVYSVLAGGLLGFSLGVAVICIADLISCSISFFLSRRYGRNQKC